MLMTPCDADELRKGVVLITFDRSAMVGPYPLSFIC